MSDCKCECKYEKIFTEEETEGMAWLDRVLEAVCEKGPNHRSFKKALAAAQAINKMEQHRHELHCAAHGLEERIMMFVHAQMHSMPEGQA
ncbi:hypothetical protein LCGC14_3006130 [marine sediment metagenome]|uniref:Uncharacterized protein n=1 Tax=marine sediment metagenome TaxID=412755 RepID=A0A0F8X025_9ZZZZ